MSSVIYAKFVVCDACGAKAESPQPDSVTIPTPTPDGWLWLGYGEIRREDGSSAVRDLCPACRIKPFDEIYRLRDA
jgi:hypothetical protein